MNNEMISKILLDVPDYQDFLTVDELNASTQALAETYPEIVTLQTVGHFQLIIKPFIIQHHCLKPRR